MSLVGFKAKNHPQQVGAGGSDLDVDDRATEAAFFQALDSRFHFSIDVAAATHNTKCERFYDRVTDGLAQSWAGERVWCNPPYSSIGPWVEKAWAEIPTAELVVMLLPANRTEQTWWQELVERLPRPAGLAADRRVPARPPAVHQGRSHDDRRQ